MKFKIKTRNRSIFKHIAKRLRDASKQIFLLFTLAFISTSIFAQELIIGTTAADYTTMTPYRGAYEDARYQVIYLASELTTPTSGTGMTANNTITNFSVYIKEKNSTSAYNGFTVKFAHTSYATFPSNAFLSETWTTVHSSSYTITGTGWNSHTFSNDFVWNGTDNIVIEFCFDNTTWSGSDYPSRTSLNANTIVYDQADGDVGCSLSTPARGAYRPIIKLNYSTCAATTAGSIGNTQTICYDGNPTTITNVTSPSGGTGTWTYQWYYDDDCDGGWNLITGATSSTYNPPAGLTTSRCYRRTEIEACGTEESNEIEVSLYNDTGTDFTWVGNVDENWLNCANWGNGRIPTASDNVIIPSGCSHWPDASYNSTGTHICNNLTVNSSATLKSTLDDDSYYINGKLMLSSGSTFTHSLGKIWILGDCEVDGTWNPSGGYIVSYGNWDDSQGTFQASVTTYFYKAGTQTIKCAASNYFHNIIIGTTSASATIFDLLTNMDVNQDISIRASSTLDGNSYIIKCGDDWANSGSFIYGTSTVVFDGATQQDMNIGIDRVESFYNVTVEGSDVRFYYDESGIRKINIHNDLTINTGKKLSTVKQP